jgi:hypothetical protein
MRATLRDRPARPDRATATLEVGGDPGARLPRFTVEADVGDTDRLDPGEQDVVLAFAVLLERAW